MRRLFHCSSQLLLGLTSLIMLILTLDSHAPARPPREMQVLAQITAKIIPGRDEPPQGRAAVKHGQMKPAPCISFKQISTNGAVYDTLLLPLDVDQRANIEVTRLRCRDRAGNELTPREVCALRIDTAQGTDYFLNDLRQECIGPTNGHLKTAGLIQTDGRAAVIRLDANGRLQRASAAGASFIKLDGATIWSYSTHASR